MSRIVVAGKPFAVWGKTIDATISAMKDAMAAWVSEDDIEEIMDAEPVVFSGGWVALPVPEGWPAIDGPIPGGRFIRIENITYYAVAIRLVMPAEQA